MPKTSRPTQDGLQFRSFGVQSDSWSEEERAINGIAATEKPVMMPDWDRMEMVPEVLLMSGAKFPADRRVPALNSHQRFDADHVIGSAMDLRVQDGEMPVRMVFSSECKSIATKVKEGHLRDLSVGYKIDKKRYIPANTTEKIGGRTFTGPMNVVTSWTVREVSVTPIGADCQAKMRGLSGNPFERKETMLTQEQRDTLVARGMSADLDDSAAVAWAIANPVKEQRSDPEPEKPKDDGKGGEGEGSARKDQLPNADDIATKAADLISAKIENRRKLDKYIRTECRSLGIPDEMADTIIDEAKDEADAGRKMIAALKTTPTNDNYVIRRGSIGFGMDQKDKFRDIMGTIIKLRVLETSGLKPETVEKLFPEAARAKGHEQVAHWGMLRVAEECVRQDGVNTDLLDKMSIARGILGSPADREALGFRSGDSAYHTTGSFPKLTQDAMNMTLRGGYIEYPSTWREVFTTGEPFTDFKAKHVIQMGNFPNVPVLPDNDVPNQISIADAEETYKPEARSFMLSYSWRLLVNDSLGGLGRSAAEMGKSFARTTNTEAWSVITGTTTMQDGVALWSAATGSRKKSNYTASGAAPSVAQLQVGMNLMMQQVGLNTPEDNASEAILGITPEAIVGPSALMTTIIQLVGSAFDPVSNKFMVKNTATGLKPVIEPLLDANSTTAWYLFGNQSAYPVVEVSFLRGYETPQTRSWRDEKTLALMYAALYAFGVKAIDWRGGYKDNGA